MSFFSRLTRTIGSKPPRVPRPQQHKVIDSKPDGQALVAVQDQAREILFAAKEEAIKIRAEASEEARKLRVEVVELERRLAQKEEAIDQKNISLLTNVTILPKPKMK